MGRYKLPVEQRKDVVIGVRIERSLKKKLDNVARKLDLTLAQIYSRALREYAEKHVEKRSAKRTEGKAP